VSSATNSNQLTIVASISPICDHQTLETAYILGMSKKQDDKEAFF